MGRFILGVVIGLLLVAGGAYVYFTTGMAPAAATAAPMPFEKYFAGKALHAKLQQEAPKVVPIQATPQNLLDGAQVYQQHCMFCHGLQNKPSAVGPVMYPHAPQLFRRPPNFNPATMHFGVTDDPPGVTYWKVKNGVRLTGMPSFQKVLTDQQMWDVALLLSNAAHLPPEVDAALAPMTMPISATPAPAAPPAKPASSPKSR